MKRALILVVAIAMVLTGCFMDGEKAKAEVSVGKHYLKGRVIALEACYTSSDKYGSTCLGIMEVHDTKRSGRIMGDAQIGSSVYKQCEWSGELVCEETWHTSVGEEYMRGGEVPSL